jgi:hypothetical protein
MCKYINTSFLLFVSFLFFPSCDNNKAPLFKKDLSSIAEKENNLFVFIGEKLDFKELPQEEISMDGKFYGKYKVLQHVYGEYKFDTIEFTTYDHYGIPNFSNYKNVMLFVRERKGKFFHEKYQFYDVYKTVDDRWAGRYWRKESKSMQKMSFAEEVSFPLSMVNRKETGCWFPAPYYRIEGDRAFAEYGIYIEDLFKTKRDGILTVRGLFGNGKPGELTILETEMAEIKKRDDSLENDWKNFGLFWNKMRTKPGDTIAQRIYDFVLDSIVSKDTLYSEHNNNDVVPVEVLRNLQKRNELDYRNIEIAGTGPYFEGTIVIDTINTFEIKVRASFLKSLTGFNLYSLKQERKCICGY